MLGKKIIQNTIRKGDINTSISLDDHPSGIYLLRLSTGDTMITKKLIKN